MIAILLTASIAVLLGAYGFEYIGGLAPCRLCNYQRVAYFLAILISAVAWLRPGTAHWMTAILVADFLTGAGLGIYHAGVEWRWWAGLASCSAPGGYGGTAEQLLAQILAAPVVLCDKVAWSLFGISLAGYNALISTGLAMLAAAIFLNGRKDKIHGRI
ncbi:MAG: disulfide bond formation protein B [Alphaproteobacteria bacterium]|nr:disulfide bond formation protein B [Alphaproteobacteria bacterium]